MGVPQIATSFYTFSAASYLAERSIEKPAWNLRHVCPWVTADFTASSGVFLLDFLGSVTPAGFFFDNAGFGAVNICTFDNGTFTPILSNVPVPYDDRVGRRKVWVPYAGAASRHWLILGDDADTGAPVSSWELGSVLVPVLWSDLADYPEPPEFEVLRQTTDQGYLGGGGERNVESHVRLQYVLQQTAYLTAALLSSPNMVTFGYTLTPGTRCLFFENQGEMQHAYSLQLVEDPAVTERVSTFGQTLVLREVW